MAPLTTRRQRRLTALVLTLLLAWVVVGTEPGSSLDRFIELSTESGASGDGASAGFVPNLAATMVDSFPGGFDVDTDGKADPGDKIRYTAAISNSGPDPATNLHFALTAGASTSLVAGSITASPVALNDTFPVTVVGNVSINSANLASPFSVTTNDFRGLNPLATISSFDASTANGGQVVMTTTGADLGKFTYDPPAGFEGTDTFTYTLADNATAPSAAANRTATVSITVSGMVWFVNNTATACTIAGCGRLSNPFSTLDAFNTLNTGTGNNPADNDNIFFYESATVYTGPLSLRSGQKLIGQDATVSLSTITGLTPPQGSPSFPPMNTGGNPAFISTPGFTGAVNNQTNVIPALIRGFSLSAAGKVIDVSLTANVTGTLEIKDNIIVQAGAEGIDINKDGAGTLTLDVQNNAWNMANTHTGNAFDVTEGNSGNPGNTRLNFSGNTNIKSSATAVLLNGLPAGGAFTVTGFANNTVHQSSAATGISVNTVTFDANVGTTAFETVSGGTTAIGVSGDGVGTIGMLLTSVSGDLSFTDLDIFASNGAGLQVTGTGAVTLSPTGSGMRLSANGGVASVGATNGPAVDITSATVDLNFLSITSTSGTTGLQLVSINDGNGGTLASVFQAGSGSSITNAGTTDVVINSNNADVTYAGTITDDVGALVSMGSNTGGTKTLSGAITDNDNGSGNGISLTTNTSTTIRFSGGLVLSTGGNAAFTATTNTGAVEVCDESLCSPGATGALINKLTTTTGTALNVANTTIGANKLEFRSISAGTGAAGPSSGIILNSTGSLGGLKISGNGGGCTTAANCTGGAIQDTSSSGISLTNTQKVTIDRIFIQDTVKSGISGTTVVDFTLTNSTIDNSGNTTGNDFSNLGFGFDSAVTENNLSGVVVITGNTLTDAWMHGIDIQNFAGTISDATISNNTLTSSTSSGTSHGSAIRLLGFGHAGATSNITKATISGNTITNFPGGAGITAQYGNNSAGPAGVWGTPGDATNRIFIQSNLIKGQSAANPMNTNAILMTLTGKGQANWLADGNGTAANPIANIGGAEIGVTVRGVNPVATCDITNNWIVGITNVAAQGIAFAADFLTASTDAPQLSGTITGNNISGQDGQAIQVLATPGSSAHIDVTVKNNTTTAPNCGGCNRFGITAEVGSSSATVTGAPSMCLDMSGNSAAGSGVNPGIGIRKKTAAYVFNIENFVGGGDPTVFLAGLNPAGGGVLMISESTGFGNCSSAPNAMYRPERREYLADAGDGFPKANWLVTLVTKGLKGISATTGRLVSTPAVSSFGGPLSGGRDRNAFVASSGSGTGSMSSHQRHSDEVVSSRPGGREIRPATDIARTQFVEGTVIPVASFEPQQLLRVTRAVAARGSGLQAVAMPPSRETVWSLVQSEVSSLLTLIRDGVTGLSVPLHASGPSSGGSPMFADVDVDVPTLPASKAVTIVFDVLVATPPIAQYSNQGTVTADGGINMVTDDPDIGGANDPTLTNGDLYNTTTALVSSQNPSDFGNPVTFTATVTRNEGALDPTGTVQFKDGGVDMESAVACTGGAADTCVAQLVKSDLTAATHPITAVYSGDANHDTSTSNQVDQEVIPCTTNPIVTTNADGTGPVPAGSLREAIANACANNTITFNSGLGPITLSSGLTLTKNVTIDNANAATQVVQRTGGGEFRILTLDTGLTVTIKGLTLMGGVVSGAGPSAAGGAIYNDRSALTIVNTTISGNAAQYGGGVYNDGGSGSATLNVVNSTISGNSVAAGGGGVWNVGAGGTLTLLNSTLSGNQSQAVGGGLWNINSAVATLTNVTVTANVVDSGNSGSGTGGGLEVESGSVTLKNTIVAGNLNEGGAIDPADDISGAVSGTSSASLVGDGTGMTGITHGNNGNLVGTSGSPIDPRLGALASNGGPTQTHALLIDSPALDAGDNCVFDNNCVPAVGVALLTDQRGGSFDRKRDSADGDTTRTVDIGALEADPTIADITDQSTAEDTQKVVVFNVGDGNAGGVQFSGTNSVAFPASSSNTGVVTNANVVVTGTDTTRTLTLTPVANASGSTTITVTATKTIDGTVVTMQDTFLLTVTAVNDPPSFVKGADQTVDEDSGAATVVGWATAISPGPNDPAQTLTFNVSFTTTGTLAFTAAPAIDATTGNLTYTPTGNTDGTADVSVTLSDNGSNVAPNSNTSAPQTFTITVNPINDPPSFVKGADQSIAENAGGQSVSTWATSISQGPNESGQTLTFTVTAGPTTGNLAFTAPPGISASGTLTYTPTANTNGSADFSVTLADNGSSAPPNSNTSGAQTFTITVTAVNNAPVNTVPGPLSMPRDTVLTFTGANVISIADVDAAEAPSDGVVSVALTATQGVLTLSGTTGLTFTGGTNNGSASINIDGTITDINAALNGMTFVPTAGYTGAASVQIVTNDQGKIGSGGAKTDDDTVAITVDPLVAIYINEVLVNPPGTDAPNEYIELRGTPSATLPAGTYLIAVEGDAADNPGDVQTIINLSGLSFGTNGFLVLLQDGNTYTTDAGATVVTSSTAGFGGLPGSIFNADAAATDIEDPSVTFLLIQTGVAPALTNDIDSNDDGLTNGAVFAGWAVRDSISAMNGGANARAYGAFGVRNTAGSGSSVGTEVSVPFIPAYVGRIGDSTGATAADWLASGVLGGAAPNWTLGTASETQPAGFAGKPLNHIGASNFANLPPANTVPGAQSVNEDATLTFNLANANRISIADPDAGGASVQVTLTAVNGTMSLSGTAGLTFTPPGATNDGVNDAQMIFTGSIAAINAALDGLTFSPIPNYGGAASLTLLTDDLGNTGGNGNKTDTDVISITVNAINDPPSFTKGADPVITEDAGAQTVSGWATAISQGPGESGQTLTFNITPGATTGDLAFSSGVAIDPATGTLTYTAQAQTHGTAAFSVTLSDNAGGADTSGAQAFTITVTEVNDAPTAAADALSNVAEDSGVRTIPFADLTGNDSKGPANEAGQTLIVKTVSNPVGGTVSISSPNVLFTPNADFHGPAGFDYTVEDNGTTAGNPAPQSSAAAAVSLTVTPVADAPAVTGATTTNVNTQTEDIFVNRNGADTGEVTFFKITSLQNGTLFQHDGTTPIAVPGFIPVADGQAGLRFTPDNNESDPGPFGFDVQASLNNTDGGLGGSVVPVSISVSCDNPAVVTNTLDDGSAGTLRYAIARVCAGGTITFDPIAFDPLGSPYLLTLASGLTIAKSLTITGPASAIVTIAGNNTFRLMNISGAGVNVSIANLSFTLGRPQGGTNAGVIEFNNAGTLTLTNVDVHDNAGAFGIYSNDSTGITVSRSTFRNNTANRLVVVEVTPLTVLNSTFSNNGGSAIHNRAPGTIVTNTTLANNGTGLYVDEGGCACAPSVTVTNTVFSGNGTNLGRVAPATIVSGGHNLIDDGTHTEFTAVDPTNIIVAPGAAGIAALAANGGRNQTHALLSGSPALDAGNNAASDAAGLTTDQRGAGFARKLDAGDADMTQTVDIGAFEADPMIEKIADKTTAEDTPLSFSFNIGDAATPFDSITATSSNTTLVPNASLDLTGSGSTRTLTITPAANENGTATITVIAVKTISGEVVDVKVPFVVAVTEVNDPPAAVADTLTNVAEDSGQRTIPFATLTGNDSRGPANEGGQALVVQSVGGAVGGTVSMDAANVYFTPAPGFHGPASFTYTVADDGTTNGAPNPLTSAASASVTFDVNTLADTPSVTNATTDEDTQTTSGLVITRNASDGPEVTHFKVTTITGGTLFQTDGTTPIANNTFITVAQGNAGLKFTPGANLHSPTTSFVFDVQASTSSGDAGLGGSTATATITVNTLADVPSVTNTTTNEDTQSSSGLVITKNPADGVEVTHFLISSITNGTLFQNDGTTPIADGSTITVAQGGAGLRFTPSANSHVTTGAATFQVQGAINGAGAGASAAALATITVNPIADTPSVTNATTNEDTQTTSGLVVSRHAADGPEVTHVKITNITGGTLFHNNGTTPIANGNFITFAQGSAGLKFTPPANSIANGQFTVQASTSAVDGGLGGGTVNATITVTPIADTPAVTNATTNEDTQSTSGLVITRSVADGAEVTHVKITAITGGALFQNDGTTPIANGDFLTVSQGAAGLKFTPSSNSSATGHFTVQASTSAADAGLGGATVTADITVAAVADTPSVTNATTIEDTQTPSGLVISRHASDGAEVTHFNITAITGGTLFQNDGTTAIANGAFITFAQGNAGLKFTPAPNSIANGQFTAQASTSAVDGGLGGGTVNATITVTPVADTPAVTNATTNEDTQSTTGLVISRSPADGAEVTHVKITAITGGALFQNDGTTPIASGDFITVAQGNAGLTFTPAANAFATGHFTVQASLSASDAGLGGGTVTADIVVNPVADTPSVTNATTLVNAQTTSGLVVSRNAVDGADVTHLKITGITNGTLFQSDGTTAIGNNTFITAAQGAAGLKFTPALNLSSPTSAFGFDVQASVAAADAGLGGAVVHATVTVNKRAPTVVVTSSVNPATAGNPVTLTATVSGPPTASGTVQFQDGAANLGGLVTLAGGQATFNTSTLTPGNHPITAVYSGDAVYLGGTSPAFAQNIVCQAITVSPDTLANGKRNVAYPPVTFTQVGAIGAVTWSLTGSLPAGMTFVNGVLSGTPTVSGTFDITVTATDANACTGTRTYALLIELGPPTIATTTGGGAANLSATSSFFQVQGTAGDDGAITGIAWTTDRGFSGDAAFAVADPAADDPSPLAVTVNWTADLPLLPGANVVTFTATDNDALTTSVQVTVTVSTLTYYFAEGATGSIFDTYFLLGNATTTPAPVTITFYKDDGTTATLDTTVAPTSRVTIPVDAVAGMANAFFGSRVVSTLAVPLSVERSTYWDSQYLAGHAAVASDQLRTRWTFAEGTTEGLPTPAGRVPFFETYLLLGNPGTTPAAVTIRYLLSGGGVVTRTATVAPGTRLTLPSAGFAGLTDQAFGMEVTSDAPIAAARSVYFGNFRGGESTEGATPSPTWFYAEAPTGPFYDSFLLLANPNATPATVTVTYYPELGPAVVKTKTVAANGRVTVHVDSEDPTLANTTVWMRVVSDLPIAAERSTFWPGPAGTWVEAHGGTGAPEAALHWALAEGAVGGPLNFQTFLLIANPSALDTTVQVTYLRDNGTTVVKTYTVLALQRRVIHVNGLVPELSNEGVAMDIRSLNNVPFIIERSLYWNGFTGGTSVTAVRVP